MSEQKEKFTIREYSDILLTLKNQGVTFRDFEEIDSSGTSVYLRHDVDNELYLLRTMAQTEAHLGVRSTYFLMTQSIAYNLNSVDAREVIEHLQNLGHAIGLHYMNESADRMSVEQIIEDLEFQRSMMERILGEPVGAFSYHQPSQFLLDLELRPSHLLNVYNLKGDFGIDYTSDTNMHWRSGHPVDLVLSGVERLQVLVHPMWWTESSLSLPERWARVRDSIVSATVDHWMIRERSLSDLNAADLKTIL